jgi:adenylate kinase family enzyme
MEMRAIVQRLVQQKHISANSMKSASKEVPWLTVDPTFSKKKEVVKVTRLETVKIMNRLFERKLSTNQVSNRVIWKDVPTEHSNYKEIMRAVE